MKLSPPMDRSLRERFAVCMLAMLLPLVVLAGASLFTLRAVIGSLDEVVEEIAGEMHPVMQLQSMIQQSVMPLHDYLLHGSRSERELFYLMCSRIDRMFGEVIGSDFQIPREAELLRDAHREWTLFRDQAAEVLDNETALGDDAALHRMEELDIRLGTITGLLEENHNLIITEMNEQKRHSYRVQHRAYLVNGGIFAAGLITALAAGIFLSRSVLSPLRLLTETANRFGDGDLGARARTGRMDELGSLAQAFNDMADKLAQNQDTLRRLATHDGLTGLYNHREFYLRVKEEIERSRRYGHVFSVLIIDIDYFKEINDTYGHQAGDRAIQDIAALLLREARPADKVARYGGDEFGVILPETPHDRALHVGERMRKSIEEYRIMPYQGEDISMTASIGVASYPQNGSAETVIVGAADQALYAAKNGGRNRVCSAPAVNPEKPGEQQ
ncbi:MAG: diguanylate cyclase [Nitrospiraceae bacterium]|nr:MAG: diguanylate cyclase [Nitrospiraceae bacterium]